jgi:hypothetical protein
MVAKTTSEQERNFVTVTLGCVAGVAVVVVHHVHHAVAGDIPDNILAHALVELAAGAFGGILVGYAIVALGKRRT